VRKGINLAQFLSTMTLFLRGGGVSNLAHLPWTFLVFWAPKRNLRDSIFFRVFTSFKSCPSARGATAADPVCSDTDVVIRQIITLILFWLLYRKTSYRITFIKSIILCVFFRICTAIVICSLCLYVMLFLLLAYWTCTRHVSKKRRIELNWIALN